MQIAKMYVKLILAGRKNFADVPSNYKVTVKNLIDEKVKNGNLTAIKIWKEANFDV